MQEEETEPTYYLDLVEEDGIGALNDWETAISREIESIEETISTFAENAEKSIERAYTGTNASSDEKEDLLSWIIAAIPGENPQIYLDEGSAQQYADRVLPKLILEDEKRREKWSDYRNLIRGCRKRVKSLESRLRAIETARREILFNQDQLNPDRQSEPIEEERLVGTLLDDRKRLEWIGDELMAKGETWAERYEQLENICDDLGIPSELRPLYKNPESLSKSYRNYIDRKTERRSG